MRVYLLRYCWILNYKIGKTEGPEEGSEIKVHDIPNKNVIVGLASVKCAWRPLAGGPLKTSFASREALGFVHKVFS